MTTQTDGARTTAPETGGTPRGRGRNAWSLVARREVMVKLADRTFVGGTLVTLLIIAALIALQVWMGGRTTTYDVAVTSPAAGELAEAMVDQAPDQPGDVRVEVEEYDGEGSARDAVESDDVDALLVEGDDGWTVVTRETAERDLQSLAQEVAAAQALSDNAADAGTSVEQLTAGSSVSFDQLEGDPQRSELNDYLGFAFAFLFYIATLLFGMTLAQSVVEEKQSRIVEMIAAAVPLRQLLAGKIVGNTVLALAQMALYVAVGLVGLSFTDLGGVVPAVTGAVGWFLAFFVVGFLALSCLWAVAGALASRNEDLQSTSGPVTILIMGVFFGGLLLEGQAQVVASFVPPASAVLMPIRVLDGDAAWWEPVLAILLLVGLAVVLVGAAERVYRRALLQTSGKLSVREAWRLEE